MSYNLQPLITNDTVKEIFDRLNGNAKLIHKALCDLGGVDSKTVIVGSLYNKTKRIVHYIKRLKNCRNEEKLQNYLTSQFYFPKLVKKHTLTNSDHDTTSELCNKVKKSNDYHHKINERLKERLKNINVSRLNQKFKRQSHTIKRQEIIISNLRKKIKENEKLRIREDKATQCNSFSKILSTLTEEIDILKDQILTESNESDEKEQIFNTKLNIKGRPYNNKIREIYYFFQSLGISFQHCAPVIKKICSVFDFDIGELPSTGTVSNFSTELGLVAKQHLCEVVQQVQDVTLHRDATTKKGRHFYGLQISNSSKCFTAGIREVKDGKATTYAECTKSVIKDLNKFTNSSDHFQILKKVRNFMTDRSATEAKVNSILSSEISKAYSPSKITSLDLPSAAISCSSSSPTAEYLKIESFKCAVHPLLQFAEVSEKEIFNLECDFNVIIEKSGKETATVNLLKYVSKLFYKDGSGDPLLASIYLKKVGVLDIPVVNFRGNRFNTLFYNARGTFYLAKHLITYLKSSKSTLNFIQNAIVISLENKHLCRALGIICEIIKEPYWKIASNDEISAIDMGFIYRRLIQLLDSSSQNPYLLLNNEIKLLPGPELSLSPVSALLFAQNENLDEITTLILGRLATALKIKCEKLFVDFLHGGKYFQPSDIIINKSKTCPPNNISVERLFARLDNKLHSGPYTTESIENCLIYSSNNTDKWLNEKNETEKENIINLAISERKNVLEMVKVNKKHLQEQRSQIIDERIVNKKEIDRKRLQRKNDILKTITDNGIWKNLNEINNELSMLKTKKDQVLALKKQINIHKELLSGNFKEKSLFQFSAKGKLFNVEQLKENLLKILHVKQDIDMDLFKDPTTLIGKNFCHVWTDQITGLDSQYNGKVLSFENDTFKVKYYGDDVDVNDDDDDDEYLLTLVEFTSDYKAGTLYFLDK